MLGKPVINNIMTTIKKNFPEETIYDTTKLQEVTNNNSKTIELEI